MSSENPLEALRERLAQFASDRDWDQFHSPKNLSMALIAETAELIEHFQWLTEEQSKNLDAKKQTEVAMELADIFIFLIRIADKTGVDLAQAAWTKIEINEARFRIEKVKGSAKRATEY